MLTHVLANMSSAPWVSTWITQQLGQEYTYCEAKDDALLFALQNGQSKEVTIGALVKWFQDKTEDEDSQYLLYLLCIKYGEIELHELVRKALERLFYCKVGPIRSIWDGGLCGVVWLSEPLEEIPPFISAKDQGDGGVAVKWQPSAELHTVLFTHLKNTAVRTKNV